MIKKVFLYLSYIFIFFNSNLLCSESEKKLKIGLLAPFSGEYRSLGNSLLFSIQLALDEIGDKNIIIVPRDSGSDENDKLTKGIQEIVEAGAKVIIGPTDSNNFKELNKYKDIIFISLSNKEPAIKDNIISIGISLESQIAALEKLIKSQKRKKTIIMYPNNEYSEFIDKKIKKIKLNNYKVFKYSPNPKVLTGEIEKLTNYAQRKRNLENRKSLLEDKEDPQSKYELKKLEQKYTIGDVNFDSLIIIDFGNSLKSVLASLVFADVDDEKVLFTTVNQWFDKSIFYENSVKNLFYPSVNFKNFKKYNEEYSKSFGLQPTEITILAYDALGLIYYVWKKNNGINSINNFFIKDKIKGKIGTFSFNDNKVFQELKIYKTENKKFKEY
jgi:ABC-type branched-subunit amino acid transport system substrate-binding protein